MTTLRIEGTVTLTASNGLEMVMNTSSAGVKTGFAFIGNPYYDDPCNVHWRRKDGETCMGCGPSHPRALPVADAYQSLYAMWAEENALFAEWEDELLNREIPEDYTREDELYELQDSF